MSLTSAFALVDNCFSLSEESYLKLPLVKTFFYIFMSFIDSISHSCSVTASEGTVRGPSGLTNEDIGQFDYV